MKEIKKLIEDPSILDATLDWKNSLTDWQSIHSDLPSTLFQCYNARHNHRTNDPMNLINGNLESKYRKTKQKMHGSYSVSSAQTTATNTNRSKTSTLSIYDRTAISHSSIPFLSSSTSSQSKWPEISSIYPQQLSTRSSSLINHYYNSKDSLINNKENIRNIHSIDHNHFPNQNRNLIPHRDRIPSSSSSKETRQMQSHHHFISPPSETSSILKTDPKLRNLIKSIERALGPEMISSLTTSKKNSYSITDSDKPPVINFKHPSYSHHCSRNDSTLFHDDRYGCHDTRLLDYPKKIQTSHISNRRYAIPKVYEPSVFQELTSFSPNLLNDLEKPTSIFHMQVKLPYSSPSVIDNDINSLDWSGHHYDNKHGLVNDSLSIRNKNSHSNSTSLSDSRKISPFESSIDLIPDLQQPIQPKIESYNGQGENHHQCVNFTSSMPQKSILESTTISSTLENFSIDSIEYLKKYNLYNKMISSKNDKYVQM